MNNGSSDDAPIPRLTMRGIGKRFGATQALQDVSLDAYPGEVLALIGENGAGKSTLMKVLSGAHPPDHGSMQLDGLPFRPTRPVEARRAGIAMIYQELNLASDLSVEDNIMLGIEVHSCGLLDFKAQRKKVRDALELLGHQDLDLRRKVGTLSIGAQQLVEIARAMVSQARVIIFDEPTSSLPLVDVERLFRVIERLKEKGIAIIYISHFLEEIRTVANRYVVLRDGRTAGEGRLTDTSNERIVSLMVGRTVDSLFPKVEHSFGKPSLDVREWSGEKLPKEVTIGLRSGEIFGLFGLVGAGRTETLRSLFGVDRTRSGSIEVASKRVGNGVRNRIHAGMGYVSEDRKGEGLAQAMSISDNLTLSHLSPYSFFGWLKLRKRWRSVDGWMKKLSVKAHSPEQTIGQLSGGNQQKVAIARVLHQEAEILLLDEPTKGIDVGTKAEIYAWIGKLAAEGKTILFVSSYLPELMAVCDTLGVMSRGRLREVRSTSEWTENEVLAEAIAND